MKKRIISILLAFILAACTISCSDEGAIDDLLSGDSTWVDSDLIDSIKETDTIREQDDFAAAVNKDWKIEIGNEYYGIFNDVENAVLENKIKLMAQSPTDEMRELGIFYDLASNWDARNEDGVKPLRKYLKDIENISDMDDLYAFFADNERNPLRISPVCITYDSIIHPEERTGYAVYMSPPSLSLEDASGSESYFDMSGDGLENFEQVENISSYILKRLGYNDKEARSILNGCLTYEKKIASADNPDPTAELNDLLHTRSEAIDTAGSFPLDELLDSWGYTKNDLFAYNSGYLKKLPSLCNEKNLEAIRSFIMVSYILNSVSFLDRDTYDTVNGFYESRTGIEEEDNSEDPYEEERLIFDTYIGSTAMVGAMNKLYVDTYFDDTSIGDLHDTTRDLINIYKEIFSSEEWLSDEGKKASIEKLDAMGINIAYQDFDSVDYSKMDLISRTKGGNFLEAYYETERFMNDHLVWLSQTDYDPKYWDPLSCDNSTTQVNAMYDPTTNSIYIYAGICEPPAYSLDMSYEEKLGGIFSIIGHEITHGFDKTGALYDKNGVQKDWLPYDDQLAFNDKNSDVAAYYSGFSPFPSSGLYDGSLVSGEATADMGGIKATLKLASKVPDFDYDIYFRNYAHLWRANVSLKEEKENFSGDPHPLNFYRINIGLQQFDEFIETYGIKEGDGMYLAPENRINVW
ncbi:MAG: M13 family metallopeptidase [Lachnospiraceae bacterium]|nr:M13 family metallopeptidase [Lachnospiraceae bacterium]